MGDKSLGDAVEGEADDARTRRLKLIAAVEGDDWSAVIEQQTAETTVVSLGAGGEVSGSGHGRQDWQGWLAGWAACSGTVAAAIAVPDAAARLPLALAGALKWGHDLPFPFPAAGWCAAGRRRRSPAAAAAADCDALCARLGAPCSG